MRSKDTEFAAIKLSRCLPFQKAHDTDDTRVLGITIRNCAGSPNNCVPRRSKVSATDVTAKTICELSVLVLAWRSVAKFTCMPSAPTPPPLNLELFLDLPVFSFKLFPDLLGTCGNLAHFQIPPRHSQ